MNQHAANSSKALIVKLSSLGDICHALPAVHQVAQHFGEKVDWVVQPPYEDFVSCFDCVDRVISYPRKNFFTGFPSFVKELQQRTYALALDMQGLFKSALVAKCSKASRVVGPAHSREGARLFYNEVAGTPDKRRHALDEAMGFLDGLGIEPSGISYPAAFPKISVEGQGPRVAFVPCSRWPGKNWPPEYFITAGRELVERCDAAIYLVGSSDDRETCSKIEAGIGGGCQNLCSETTLPQLAGLLREMDLVITVDSGPMHVAVMVGVMVLAVFGPTDPLKTGPYGDRQKVLQGERARAAAGQRIYKQEVDYMADVTADAVVEAAAELLAKR